jgi:streptogramin lyase
VDVAADGVIWAGNAQGLWKFDGGSWRQFRSTGPPGNWIQGIALQASTLYVATRDGGAGRYDDAHGWREFAGGCPLVDTCLVEGGFVFACMVDREGYKWFGDWTNALSRLDDSGPVPQFTHFFRDSVQFTYEWSSAQDPTGPRWFGLDTGCRGCGPGTEPQGLIRIDDDGTRNNFKPTNSAMTSNQPRAIAFAPDGTMWVGYADFGVDLFSDRNLQTRLRHLGANIVDKLRSDNIWGITFDGSTAYVLADGGVSKYTANGGASLTFLESIFTPTISANGAVNPIAIDGAGGIWVATKSGLFHRPSGGLSEIFSVSNSPLVSNDVHSVAVDRATGDVWIATGEGMNRLRPGQLSGSTAVRSAKLLFAPNPIRQSVAGMTLTVQGADGTPLARQQVEVLDLMGRVLARLRTDGEGALFWNGETATGRRLSGGVYFLRAITYDAEGHRQTLAKGRLVLLP